jgi:CheY-like chemotaxis protein
MAGKRILVVDDDQNIGQSMCLLLRAWGHVAEYATSAVYALRVMDALLPEFVFIDITMPVMDGYELAQKLKGLPIGARLIAISSMSGEDAIKRSLDAGFEAHLVKPIDTARVRRLLS